MESSHSLGRKNYKYLFQYITKMTKIIIIIKTCFSNNYLYLQFIYICIAYTLMQMGKVLALGTKYKKYECNINIELGTIPVTFPRKFHNF